jgi:hypothetical protein
MTMASKKADDLLGQCRKGPSCNFIHDPAKVAVCKEFLSKGTCHLATSCNLSHEPNPHRIPACIHFLRGNCTNSQCRYAHVNVSPNAPICAAFANIGYCEKGASCLERHEFECPEYASKGACGNSRCRLPHIDRAGQLRKAVKPGQSSNTGHAGDATPMDIDHEQLGPSAAANVARFPTTEAASAAAPSDKYQAHNETGSGVFSQQQNFLSLDVDPEGDFEEMFRSGSEEKGG